MNNLHSETSMFPQVGDICYHYKHDTNDLLSHAYQIISIAKHTETSEELVIYRALYDTKEVLFISQEKLEYFARPISMFIENVEVDKLTKPRFEKIRDKNTLFLIRKALLGS